MIQMTRWRELSHQALLSFRLTTFLRYLLLLYPSKLPMGPSSKTSTRCQRAENCCQLLCCLFLLSGCCPLRMCVWFGSWIAGGQEPFVQFQWARRLTEPQQSRGAAWDIDRLEPEGSCRIGTHCQRLCYHHRLPTSKGRRGCVRERKMKGRVGGKDGKMWDFVLQNGSKRILRNGLTWQWFD